MSVSTKYISLIACLVVSVLAHFTLDAPLSRGFDDDEEGMAPCGGFNTINSTRSLLALNGGRYQIDSHHASAVVSIVLANDASMFGTTAVQQYTLTGLGTFCAQLGDLSGYTTGQNVTMQVIYKSSSESTNLYQCADVQLTDQAVTPSTCVNGTGITATNLRLGSIALSSSASATSQIAGTVSASAAKVSGSESLSGMSIALVCGLAMVSLLGTGLLCP